MSCALNLPWYKREGVQMDQNEIYLEMFALLGLYLPLFHRQKGPEPSCGLRTKLANSRRIVETEQTWSLVCCNSAWFSGTVRGGAFCFLWDSERCFPTFLDAVVALGAAQGPCAAGTARCRCFPGRKVDTRTAAAGSTAGTATAPSPWGRVFLRQGPRPTRGWEGMNAGR